MSQSFFGPFGDVLEAANAIELRQKLDLIDVEVPRRTGGRRQEHRERYCIVLYLRTLAEHARLDFPFSVERCTEDPPDFLIQENGLSYGLEITEAGSPEHQRALTQLEKSPQGSMLEEDEVRQPGESLRGRGWVGDEPERQWTKAVMREIHKKTDALARYPTDSNELLIYDVTGFAALTAWTVDELPRRLAKAVRELETQTPNGPHFRHHSVLRDRVLLHQVTGSGAVLPVPRDRDSRLLPLTRLGISEEDLRRFSRQHHIRKLAFFGSVLKTQGFGPASDVDILVEFEPDHPVGLIRMAGIERQLSELLGRKADLRTVPELSRYFREEVVRQSEPIYVAS